MAISPNSRKAESNTFLAYPSQRSQGYVSVTKVIVFVAALFTLLAIIRLYNASSSDWCFKTSVGLASTGYFLAILSASNVGNRIFRTAVLQEAVKKDGCLESGIITLYRKCNHFADFDPQRAKESHDALELIGFRSTQLKLDEPSRELEILELDSRAFEETIVAAKGKWEKRGTQFVIVPPEDDESIHSIAWQNFEKGIQKFHWRKEGNVIVTCDDADSIIDMHRYLFVYASSFHTVVNLLRAGFYLGSKQSVLIYCPSGCGRSTGRAYEGQHDEDAHALYKKKIKGRFKPQDVWLTASCGNCPMIVHLKSRLKDLPVNLILESSFADLQRDFIDPQGYIVKKFAAAHLNALSSPIPSQRKLETRYSVERMIANLTLTGKVVIVTVANDQRLKPEVADILERIFRATGSQVLHVKFQAEGPNPHSARYFRYSTPRREILAFIHS